jgi:hypothetical protein
MRVFVDDGDWFGKGYRGGNTRDNIRNSLGKVAMSIVYQGSRARLKFAGIFKYVKIDVLQHEIGLRNLR